MGFARGRHACAPPAGYSHLLRYPEFRSVYAAQLLSFAGDQIARIAVALAVFAHSHSALLTAASYAVSYLAGILAAPVTGMLADRLPRRRVMLVSDLVRLLIVAAMAAWSGSVAVLLAGMLLVAAVEPAFKSARAALLPTIAPGQAYPLALSLFAVTTQLTQVAGFAAGGAAAVLVGTRGALAFDAGTFALSAALLYRGLHPRPATGATAGTVRGLQQAVHSLWANRLVRSALVLAWCGAAFGVVPEGLAVVYAHGHGAGPLGAGILTAALPAGTAAGAVAVGRIHSDVQRRRWLYLLAVLTFLPLVAAAAGPPLPAACLLWACSGAGGAFTLISYQVITMALPDEQRGRAFGIASTGLLAAQGLALLAAGAVSDLAPVRYVIAGSGALGLLAVAAVGISWPAAAPSSAKLAAVPVGGAK